jgi:predicted transposase YdaD
MLGITWKETRVYQEAREEERRSLALKMLQENISIETITRITEFTLEQLQQLQAQVEPQ